MGKRATKKELAERVGKRFVNKYGSPFTVIKYVSSSEVYIRFDNSWEMKTTWNNLEKAKSPFCKSIHGVGYLGVDRDGIPTKPSINGKNTREYECWYNMIARCHSEIELERNPTYNKVSICERWYNYSWFLEDLPLIENYELWRDNPNSGITLDKDVKQVGVEHKIYSVETCKFVSRAESSSEMAIRTRFGKHRR